MIPPTALRQSRAAGIDLEAWDIDLRVLISASESLEETVNWCGIDWARRPRTPTG